MRIEPIKTRRIEAGDDLLAVLAGVVPELGDGRVLVVTSKVVSYAQGRLASVPDEAAFARLVEQEADGAIVPTPYVALSVKEHIIIANAGIDRSNAPAGQAVLWPSEPWAWAAAFRARLVTHYEVKRLGVVLTDSHCQPLRRGVTGVAVAYAGFEGVAREQGKADLYGRPLQFTERATADGIAAAAVVCMGESDESTPFAIVEGAPVVFTERAMEPAENAIDPKIDLFAPIFTDAFARLAERRTSG